ncbi:hypothetical protein [Streptomyces bambusae]|nr:hypothetical protein [Streptomyces bambusae]
MGEEGGEGGEWDVAARVTGVPVIGEARPGAGGLRVPMERS